MNPETRAPIRYRKLGWLMMTISLLFGIAFWWLVIRTKGDVPDYDSHRSLAGFWHDAQTAISIGWWRHGDSSAVGYYGNKEWAEKIVSQVSAGGAFEGCDGGHRDGALSQITNHDFSTATDVREAWLGWWQKNSAKTQEEWIQDGFKVHGFEIALPPTEKDWSKLLVIMGSTAGPAQASLSGRPSPPEMLYPDYLCYNAYRWLRDSKFDAVRHAVINEVANLSVEERGGLIQYAQFEKDGKSLSPPIPGRMSFALGQPWGLLGRTDEGQKPWLLKGGFQVLFTILCTGLGAAGLRLAHPRKKISPKHM